MCVHNVGLHFYDTVEKRNQVCTDNRPVVAWVWGLGLGITCDGAQENSSGAALILYNNCGSHTDKSFVKTSNVHLK